MYDINPLGPLMHLKELDRQAAPKLYPVRSTTQDASSVTICGPSMLLVLRCLHAIGIPWHVERQERSIR